MKNFLIGTFGSAAVILILLLAILMPFALIWAIEHLTQRELLDYTFKNWLAIQVIQIVLADTFKSTTSKD